MKKKIFDGEKKIISSLNDTIFEKNTPEFETIDRKKRQS